MSLYFCCMNVIAPNSSEARRVHTDNLDTSLDKVKALGLPDPFIKMWEFYLCYCEGGFEARATHGLQMVFQKPLCRREPILGEIPASDGLR